MPLTEDRDDPTTTAEPRSLTVAVLTYRRNTQLAALLPLLTEQAEALVDRVPQVSVLVVDNDPDGGAERVVREFSETSTIPVEYRCERVPGIAAARNRALSSSADTDLLVFIDDDERPVEHWLTHLLRTYLEHGHPAAVLGPVRSEFEVEPDAWVTSGDFFKRRRLVTGAEVEVGATNNLLLDLRRTREWGLAFDLEFGISGGSDTLFTKQIRARGGRMVWSAEAMVVDVVPAARVTKDWVLRRALRSGNSWSGTSLKVESRLVSRTRTRVALSGQGLVRILAGSARMLVGYVSRSSAHQAKGARSFSRGLGMLTGAWGYQYLEYKR